MRASCNFELIIEFVLDNFKDKLQQIVTWMIFFIDFGSNITFINVQFITLKDVFRWKFFLLFFWCIICFLFNLSILIFFNLMKIYLARITMRFVSSARLLLFSLIWFLISSVGWFIPILFISIRSSYISIIFLYIISIFSSFILGS